MSIIHTTHNTVFSEFSFFAEVYEKWKLSKIVVQAGSLYTLTYSILLLSLRLKLSGHYEESGAQLPCVKVRFITQ